MWDHEALGPRAPIAPRRYVHSAEAHDEAGGHVALRYDVTLRPHTVALEEAGVARVACPTAARLEVRFADAAAWRAVRERVTAPGECLHRIALRRTLVLIIVCSSHSIARIARWRTSTALAAHMHAKEKTR